MSAASASRRPAAFLDRDGTINVKRPEGDYVTEPSQLELLPGAAEGIRVLNAAGFAVVVLTNQRGIALGRMSEDDLSAVHARLLEELGREGAHVDAIYHCPHGEGECECRKPQVGLALRALREHPHLDLDSSVMVGDSSRDLEVGRRLGMRSILVGDGPAVAGVERTATLLEAAQMLAAGQPTPGRPL